MLDESTPTQAALRWPRPISGQHAEFALALAVRREHTWQPGVVYFANGAPYGYQIVAPSPANASPPVLAAGQDGTLYLTWAGLERATARRYSASTGAQGWIVPGPDQAHLLRRTITGLLPGILISLAGLIPFVLAVIFIPARTWTPAAICALYAAGKLIWPPDLFTHMPPLLAYDPAAHIAAGWRVGLTVSAILLVAMVSAAAVRIPERAGWRRWVVFAALDITLTWIIFGPAFVG